LNVEDELLRFLQEIEAPLELDLLHGELVPTFQEKLLDSLDKVEVRARGEKDLVVGQALVVFDTFLEFVMHLDGHIDYLILLLDLVLAWYFKV
jgi:hypothetical protein